MKQFEKSRDIAFRVISGKAYIVNTRTSTLCELNETGTFLWKLMDSSVIRQDLVNKMHDTYDVSFNDARKDVDEFLNELKINGLISDK